MFTKDGGGMYRLLLLDDEEIVLKGIQKVFDLPSFGFELAGVFSNPLKALEQIEGLNPHLIITDVKMPQMDGLEFASEVKKKCPETEIVILSGYDDFSYAQAAVKIGVSDYLLKPIKKEDFSTMLRHMHRKIEDKQSRENQYQMLKELVKNSYIELKNRFYLALAETNQFNENLYEALSRHGHQQLQEEDFLLIRLDTYQISTPGDYMSAIGKLTQEVETVLSDYGKVIDFWSDECLYFILFDLWEEQYEDVRETVNVLVDTKKKEGIEMSVGFSHMHQGIGELFEAKNDCLRQIFMLEANIDEMSEANPVQRREINITIPYTEIENLFHSISVNDRNGIESIIEKIYEIPENNIHVLFRDYFSSITFLVLLRIYQLQNKYNIQGKIVTQELLDLKNLRREYPSSPDQKHLVREVSLKLADVISNQKVAAPSKMIQAALDYINRHFSENISLQEVADNINISKNYLCDIFKKEIGITFINYVTNLRIEKAKEFLANTDMKMYEVSNAVGYNDYAYFSQIFKKHTGTTLSAYRKTI